MPARPAFRGWRAWLWLALVWFALGLLFAVQASVLGRVPWHFSLLFAIRDWAPWLVLSPLVLWLCRQIPITGPHWRRALALHGAAALGIAVLFEGFALVPTWAEDALLREADGTPRFLPNGTPPRPPLFAPREGWTPPDPAGGAPVGTGPRRAFLAPSTGETARLSPPRGSGRARLALPVYCLLVAAVHAVDFHQRSLERERRALLAEARLNEARLRALQMQLQPHFFFNALNAVASLVHSQPQQAEDMICEIGELMRHVLDLSDRPQLPLREELAFVDRYLAVQQMRFGARLQVQREIDAAVLDCAVPTLLLQPLVENAVVHGVAPSRSPGSVTLAAQLMGDRLRLVVANTVPASSEAPGAPRGVGPLDFPAGVGLSNTRSRLEALYGDTFTFTHQRAADGRVVATIDLPARQHRA